MNVPALHIRQATPADLAQLVAVARQAIYDAFSPGKYPGNPVQTYLDEAVTPETYARDFANHRATFWLAERQDGEAMGFMRLIRHAPPRRMPVRNALEIERLYLLDRYVGRGYGGQLMTHCLNYAQAQGCRAVWLGVWEHNQPAQTFYRKMGFVPFSWHRFHFGGEAQRDIWLWRELAAPQPH